MNYIYKNKNLFIVTLIFTLLIGAEKRNNSNGVGYDFNSLDRPLFRIGDYDTSIRSFFEVVSRHSNHPFAHFCLARSFYFKHEKVTDQVQSHLNDFYDIVDKDDKWKKYLYLLKNDVFFKKFANTEIKKLSSNTSAINEHLNL